MAPSAFRCLALLAGTTCAQRFPVPDRLQQFGTFNVNYAAEAANFTASLQTTYGTFMAVAAQNRGAITTCLAQRFEEAKMQLTSSANFSLGWSILEAINQQLLTPPENWLGDFQSPVDGAMGRCFHAFYLKLSATQELVSSLAEQGRVPPVPVTFLDQVNSPSLLLARLRSLVNIDILHNGIDTKYAANNIMADLSRLIYRKQPSNYPWHQDLFSVLLNYSLHEWRNSTSGYWGPTYRLADGSALQVPDLSTTFHITKYYAEFGIDVGLWNELGQTTVDLVDVPFPWGQYTAEGIPFNHNLYDTAQLFIQAWPAASEAARAAMAAQSHHFLNFSLTMLETAGEGLFPRTRYDDTAQTAQYFGTGTLELFGFFDAKACFWSQEDPKACLVGRSYKQRRTLYFQMAGSVFNKLAEDGGDGDSDYIDSLGKMGLTVPLQMQEYYNGTQNTSSPSMPKPPLRGVLHATSTSASLLV
jgi:hypothetical protein